MKRSIYILLAGLMMTACQSKNFSDDELRQGRLAGQFSVSENEKVYFSQGNLQYCPNIKSYRFAPDQLTVIGSMNDSISRTCKTYIDLFGYGTGKYPASYGTMNMFYSNFEDWGDNPITNGGNKGGIWRTLKDVEWLYLAKNRSRAAELCGLGKVNGKLVVLFFPDGWSRTDEPATPYMDTIRWSDIMEYSYAQYQSLEGEGVVFLPAAGYRSGKPYDEESESCVYRVGRECSYWCAPDTVTNRYCWSEVREVSLLGTRDEVVYIENDHAIHCGLAVRLVQDVR